MKNPAETMPAAAAAPAEERREPALGTLALLFWAVFAGGIVAVQAVNPAAFARFDPDGLMRLVQVRDFVAGQGWFDLMQYRLDPPAGALMHWSRLIDAPLAALVAFGNLFEQGEAFALTLWPLLLFFGLMASGMFVATALTGRRAAVPALILPFLFFSPMLAFLPNNIDHHNAQLALLIATLAAAMRLGERPRFGLAAGIGAALMLAIGLEALPYAAVLGAVIALQWAVTGQGARGTALFGVGLAVAPALLYLVAGSPAAPLACDSLSWAYAAPAAVAGLGLAVLAALLFGGGRVGRFVGLVLAGVAAVAAFVAIAPECLAGPYGFLSPELKALWLDRITEAQPVFVYSGREPAGTIAVLGPPLVALIVAARRALAGGRAWVLPAALLATALVLSLHQVRTLPYANAMAIGVLAAWLAEALEAYRRSPQPLAVRAAPLLAAFLLAMPLVHLAIGSAAVGALAAATNGRRGPTERPEAAPKLVAGRSWTERNCVDASAKELFATVPPGLVLSPVFYGSSVLAISKHSVVAAPYHRVGSAILNSIHAMDGQPVRAHAVATVRGVDYLAICAGSPETARRRFEASDGLLARLTAGERVDWLEPVSPPAPTLLRLWRVVE